MIGRFATPEDAEVALREFEDLRSSIAGEIDYDRLDENPWAWYRNSNTYNRLIQFGLYSFSPEDIEHFNRDCATERKGSDLVIQTDEDDVNGLLKFLIHKGSHIEVYSTHVFPNGPPDGGDE